MSHRGGTWRRQHGSEMLGASAAAVGEASPTGGTVSPPSGKTASSDDGDASAGAASSLPQTQHMCSLRRHGRLAATTSGTAHAGGAGWASNLGQDAVTPACGTRHPNLRSISPPRSPIGDTQAPPRTDMVGKRGPNAWPCQVNCHRSLPDDPIRPQNDWHSDLGRDRPGRAAEGHGDRECGLPMASSAFLANDRPNLANDRRMQIWTKLDQCCKVRCASATPLRRWKGPNNALGISNTVLRTV